MRDKVIIIMLTAIVIFGLIGECVSEKQMKRSAFWAGQKSLGAWQKQFSCCNCPGQFFSSDEQIDSTIQAWADSTKLYRQHWEEYFKARGRK